MSSHQEFQASISLQSGHRPVSGLPTHSGAVLPAPTERTGVRMVPVSLLPRPCITAAFAAGILAVIHSCFPSPRQAVRAAPGWRRFKGIANTNMASRGQGDRPSVPVVMAPAFLRAGNQIRPCRDGPIETRGALGLCRGGQSCWRGLGSNEPPPCSSAFLLGA